MDLPLWDSSDDQVAYESGNSTEDHLLHGFSFGYGRDVLEEDALNEKSCLQVLKIWIDKADEDIVKLEEDILMLKCQLVWDDKDWSEQCSAALREKIEQLDILIQNLKENRENSLRVENEELPPRLHDLLKPLLQNYLAKPKQTEPSTVQIPVSTAVKLSSKKSNFSTSQDCQITEENVCTGSTIMFKTYERMNKWVEHEEREIIHPKEKQNAVTRESDASAHSFPNDEASENFISKPITPDGRGTANLVHAESERSPDQSEPADSVVKKSNTSTSIEKVNSGEKEEMRHIEEKEEKSNSLSPILSTAGVITVRHQYQSKVTLLYLKTNETGSPISETVEEDPMKPRTEASSKVRKAGVYRRSTKENVLSVKPSVKKTKFSETTEAAEAPNTEMKISLCSGPSSTENLMGQNKNGVTKGMSKNGKKENLQQSIKTHLADTSVVAATPFLLPQEVRRLSFFAQTTCKKEYLTGSGMKLAKKEDVACSSTTEEATDGVKNTARSSTLCTKNHKTKLTCSYLREIAKSQKLRGYYKLKKEELLKRLGF